MKANLILCPTDFSPDSELSLRHATFLARDTGATLLIVHVEPPPAYTEYGFGGIAFEESAEKLMDLLRQVRPMDPNVSCEHELLRGEPADVLVRYAQERGVDFIVMGTHGRTGLTRLLMGSVAEAVVRRASCPVLTIKQPNAVTAGAT